MTSGGIATHNSRPADLMLRNLARSVARPATWCRARPLQAQRFKPRLVHCARALTTQALAGPWTRHVSRPAQNGPNDTASPWSSTFTARTMPRAARPIGSESVPLLASTDLHTRVSLRLLACTYHDQKCWDTKETLRLMQLVDAGHREAEGGAHPDTAAALSLCGQLMSLDGQGVAAIAKLREALATYRCALGHSHPATLISMVMLGKQLERSAFRLDEVYRARRLERAEVVAFKAEEKELNEYSNARRAFLLAASEAEFLEAEEAEAAAAKQQAEEEQLEEEAAEAAAQADAAESVEEALLLYQEVLAERSVMLGSTHEDTIEISHCVAALLKRAGKLGATLHIHQQNAALCLAKFGADDQRTLSSVNTLCDHLFEHGPSDKATRVEVRKAMQEVLARKRALHNYPNQTQSARCAMELLYRLHRDACDNDAADELLDQWEALENTSGTPEYSARVITWIRERRHSSQLFAASPITICLFGFCTVVGYDHHLMKLAAQSASGMAHSLVAHQALLVAWSRARVNLEAWWEEQDRIASADDWGGAFAREEKLARKARAIKRKLLKAEKVANDRNGLVYPPAEPTIWDCFWGRN